MKSPVEELVEIREELRLTLQRAANAKAKETLESLLESARRIDRAHSKSWFGYQARIYTVDLEPPAAEHQFDPMHGKLLTSQAAWIEYSNEQIKDVITKEMPQQMIKSAAHIASNVRAEGG